MSTLSEGQIRGDLGERWFAAHLPRGWLLQRPTTDIGVDGLVVVCEPGALNGIEFRVQIKTSKSFVKRQDRYDLRDLVQKRLLEPTGGRGWRTAYRVREETA